MNHATLVDSMLRDWDLPVARSQEAFDYWRKNRRGPVWKEIEGALEKLGVDQSAMAGEHLVFSVRVSGTDLLIQPVHILDLGRAVLVSDPKSNVTRVVDAWSEREPVLLEAAKNNPVNTAKDLAMAAVSSAEKGNVNAGRDQMLRALAVQPESAFQVVEHSWATLFRDDTALRSDLTPKVKKIALRQERLAVVDSLFNSPDVKDDEKAFVRHLADALNADPGLPVDLHLALAVRIAQSMAEIADELVKRGEQGHAYTPWQIVELSLNSGGLNSPPVVDLDKLSSQIERRDQGYDSQPDASSSLICLKKAAYFFEKYYDVDPDKVLSTSLLIVKKRAPRYLGLAMQVGSMPKQESDEMLALVRGEEVSVVEWDAAELDGVQDQLLRRTHAQKAAEMLWSHKEVDPNKVNEELNKASQRDTGGTSPAFRSASERLKEFVKSGNKPDTLARVEIGQTIEAGSKELLLRAVERMKNRKTVYATVLSDHARLAARLSFEQNHYAEALDIMFPNSSPISLYHPSITWASKTDFAGSADSVTATCEGGNLIVGTPSNGRAIMEVIRIQGLPTSDACNLAKEVQNNWIPSDFGRVFERVLVTRVPLRSEAQSVRKTYFGTAYKTRAAEGYGL